MVKKFFLLIVRLGNKRIFCTAIEKNHGSGDPSIAWIRLAGKFLAKGKIKFPHPEPNSKIFSHPSGSNEKSAFLALREVGIGEIP